MRRPKAVEVIDKTTAYAGYLRIDRYRLRHELFAGTMSAEIVREVMERGHAVGVLPYDPVRDEVVLIEQFRIGALAAGRPAWLIEIVAGIIEPGESAEAVARRETLEETGCAVDDLVAALDLYSSPGASTESIQIVIARSTTELAGGFHGKAEEGEDIRVVVMAFETALAALDRGEIQFGPAAVALQWLARHRPALQRRWA